MFCNYPDCLSKASKTWALAPVCTRHHDLIRTEVIAHYKSRTLIARPHYDAILPYTFKGSQPKRQIKGHYDMLSWTGIDRFQYRRAAK